MDPKLRVREGDEVKAGDALIEGAINPNEILAIKGPEGVYEYLIQEVQKKFIVTKVLISMTKNTLR